MAHASKVTGFSRISEAERKYDRPGAYALMLKSGMTEDQRASFRRKPYQVIQAEKLKVLQKEKINV